jgi:acetyltransferase-like isoleucine patch superfamily enzyme
MASPCALKMGPLTNAACPSKKYYLIEILIMWFGLLPTVILEFFYFGLVFEKNLFNWNIYQVIMDFFMLINPWGKIVLWIIFPLNILAGFYLYAFSSIKVTRLFLFFETKLYPPKEGIFPRDFNNKDYYHWHARRVIKKFPAWLLKLTPFPWMKRSYIHNQLGATIGKNVGLLDCWIDVEFVTIEDNVMIGRAAAITSHYFTSEYLIVKAITIKKDVIIGAKARISPGTLMEEGSTVLARSVTKIEQNMPEGSIFSGNPAEQVEYKQ